MALTGLGRLNLSKALKVFGFFEMLFWFLLTVITYTVYKKNSEDPNILNEILAKSESSKKQAAAADEYRRLLQSWEKATDWAVTTSSFLFFAQLFLVFGIQKKNRCLIFSWILSNLFLGTARIIVCSTLEVPSYLKYLLVLWVARCAFIYFAAKLMLQITNERIGAEEIEPPHFRPQTDDPREFREGLNYPAFPRSLEFATRVSAMNRQEHADPKRWVPTYDAIDSDGRMVVVVDDPFYEAL